MVEASANSNGCSAYCNCPYCCGLIGLQAGYSLKCLHAPSACLELYMYTYLYRMETCLPERRGTHCLPTCSWSPRTSSCHVQMQTARLIIVANYSSILPQSASDLLMQNPMHLALQFSCMSWRPQSPKSWKISGCVVRLWKLLVVHSSQLSQHVTCHISMRMATS